MKKYMIVATGEGMDGQETCATFKDSYNEARNVKINYECGLGWYAEIYERTETEFGKEYVFLEA